MILIGKFKTIEDSTYKHLSGLGVYIDTDERFYIEEENIPLTKQQVIELIHSSMLVPLEDIPELNISVPLNIIMNNSEDFLKLIIENNKPHRAFHTELKTQREIKQKKFIMNTHASVFWLSALIPGYSYFALKRYKLGISFLVMLSILIYLSLSITASLLVTLWIVMFAAIISAIIGYNEVLNGSTHLDKQYIFPYSILVPVSFIIVEIFNIIFYKGELFMKIQIEFFKLHNIIAEHIDILDTVELNYISINKIAFPDFNVILLSVVVYISFILLIFIFMILFKKNRIYNDFKE